MAKLSKQYLALRAFAVIRATTHRALAGDTLKPGADPVVSPMPQSPTRLVDDDGDLLWGFRNVLRGGCILMHELSCCAAAMIAVSRDREKNADKAGGSAQTGLPTRPKL